MKLPIIKYGLIICVACSYGLPLLSIAQSDDAALAQAQQRFNRYFSLSATAAFTSNYVWRGVSQSDNRPAMQGSFTLAGNPGFYTTVWGSSINYLDPYGNPATSEIDIILGFKKQFESLQYNLTIQRDLYPKTLGLDYTEYGAAIAWRILRLGLYYTNDVGNGDGPRTYWNAGLEMPAPASDRLPFLHNVTLGAAVGYSAYYGTPPPNANYLDYHLYIVKKVLKNFSLQLDWTDTNGAYNSPPLDGSTIIGTIIASI